VRKQLGTGMPIHRFDGESERSRVQEYGKGSPDSSIYQIWGCPRALLPRPKVAKIFQKDNS
jgi:hypothetical protein